MEACVCLCVSAQKDGETMVGSLDINLQIIIHAFVMNFFKNSFASLMSDLWNSGEQLL